MVAPPDDWRPRRFYERWRWIEWLLAGIVGYLFVASLATDTGSTAVWLTVIVFIAYKIVAYFIDLSERQCRVCGARARNDETRCNNCGESLALSEQS